LSVSQAFGEKIKANYLLTAATFAPGELLFLLVNPPETPAAAGDIFNLAVQRSSSNTHNLTIDIANNIVNRVLLEDKSAPSYQDSVYIDIALRKLGIENTALFMARTRALRAETLQTRELVRLYQEKSSAWREYLAGEAEARRAGGGAGAPAETAAPTQETGAYYLHNEIFRRQDTARLITALIRSAGTGGENYTRLSERELRLAEYGRSAQMLTLNAYRRQISAPAGGDIFYHRNHYELAPALPAPAGEKAVLAQAAAAALLQLIDNTLSCRTENYRFERRQWLDLRTALRQTGENSLRRFISFHEEGGGGAAGGGAETLRLPARLTEREAAILARSPLSPPPPESGAAGGEAESGPADALPTKRASSGPPAAVPAAPREGAALLREVYRELRLALSPLPSPPGGGGGDDGGDLSPPPPGEGVRAYLPVAALSPDISQPGAPEYRAPYPGAALPPAAAGPRPAERAETAGAAVAAAAEARPPLPAAAPPARRGAGVEVYTAAIRERLERQTIIFTQAEAPEAAAAEFSAASAAVEAGAPPPVRAAERLPGAETPLPRTLKRMLSAASGAPGAAGPGSPAPAPPPAPTAEGPAAEAAVGGSEAAGSPPLAPAASPLGPVAAPPPADLRTALERINQENKERLVRLRGEQAIIHPPAPPPAPRLPDKERTMRAALRAAHDPAAIPAPAGGGRGEAPPLLRPAPAPLGAEYLTHIDETSRRVLESLRLLRDDPAAAAAAGIRVQDSPAALMTEVAAVERARESLAPPSPSRPGAPPPLPPAAAGAAADLTARLREAAGLDGADRPPPPPGASLWLQSPLIHRRPAAPAEEEAGGSGRAAAAEIARRVEKADQSARTTEIQTETYRAAQDLTAKNAEDITELINTTLRRQIGLITERVYGQLERKLQGEKARRGRM
jgi:hypothetical protein